MPAKLTHKKCFEFYGVVPKNPRWSWSGRSPDGKCVAVTLWQDKFTDKGARYSSGDHADKKWMSSPGHNELFENLTWAQSNCGGEVRVIVAIPKDRGASPRSIKECFPQERLRMRIVHLDGDAGDFVLERIS